ncbi:MAG: hypothetical protein E7448_04780, partial [Ruminococcaceae bacterium]|nr:hypothetical protein [Oscillospiraceae bacterium]
MKNVMKRVVSLSLTLCLLMAMVLTTIPALAAENEGMYKPSAAGEILYWGSNAVSAKNQTVKFTARLNSPSDNYNKSQFLISLRAESLGNPWDGANTGYWIYVDNTSVLVRYNNATIFKTDDDSFSAVPGYADTRWTLTAMEEAAGSRKALWTAEHEYEFSAINEDGGVRLIAKVDDRVILNW